MKEITDYVNDEIKIKSVIAGKGKCIARNWRCVACNWLCAAHNCLNIILGILCRNWIYDKLYEQLFELITDGFEIGCNTTGLSNIGVNRGDSENCMYVVGAQLGSKEREQSVGGLKEEVSMRVKKKKAIQVAGRFAHGRRQGVG